MSSPLPSRPPEPAIIIHRQPGWDEPDRPFRFFLLGIIAAALAVSACSPAGWASLTAKGGYHRQRIVAMAMNVVGQLPVAIIFSTASVLLFVVAARKFTTRQRWRARTNTHPTDERKF